MQNLFKYGTFKSHAGKTLHWKIDCDALTKEDWNCLAQIALTRIPIFEEVVGIPRGGIALAEAMAPHATPGCGILLICDDVYTTGKSMNDEFSKHPGRAMLGLVAFARNPINHNDAGWIQSIWTMSIDDKLYGN